ncbi:MAG: hypothetical protein MUD01_22650 [Chloroflexaceae bacterium]|nr:hypothetical protein [Chloroflexaceae bacterium]
MNVSVTPRYDRIVSLVFVVIIGLAVIFLIDVNPNILRARLGGDLPIITVSWLLIASLVMITSAGADLLARSHPQMQTRALPVLNLGFVAFELAPAFWILPSFSVVSSFAFFRLFNNLLPGTAFVFALGAAGGLLLLVLTAQHYALERDTTRSQQARLLLQIVAFLLAFGIFCAIFFARLRTVYAAPLIGASATALAYALFQLSPRRGQFGMALLVGLILAETIWALNYWATTFLLGGLVLLIIFYVLVSLLQHHMEGTLQRRLLVEYSLVGSGVLVAVAAVTLL